MFWHTVAMFLVRSFGRELEKKKYSKLIHQSIQYFHIDHNAPCLPSKSLHNHCFPFLPDIAVVPIEIDDNGYHEGALWSMLKL